MFAYELPVKTAEPKKHTPDSSLEAFQVLNDSILVYNFHNLTLQDRVFLFTVNRIKQAVGSLLASVSELFPNASWLEREVAELHGLVFMGKKDTRNLMLQYGDTTLPFLKQTPSIGYKEVFYDSLSDTLTEVTVTING